MAITAVRAKSVLSYLKDMVELCRNAHRPDLVRDYQDAWEEVAARIYGPLPRRLGNQGPYVTSEVESRPVNTVWRRQMLAKPWRRVIARDGDFEILQCGHRIFHIEIPGTPAAGRRRCGDCVPAQEAAYSPGAASHSKKPAASATQPRRKTVTA